MWYRVTHYDPTLRSETGAFEGESWTSHLDVGRPFHGKRLTREEYDRIEDAYVEFAGAAALKNGVGVVSVVGAEGLDALVTADGPIATESMPPILRLLLREEAWCRLVSAEEDYRVDVGYDMYMYVFVQNEPLDAVREAESKGLFIEPGFPSPHATEGDV